MLYADSILVMSLDSLCSYVSYLKRSGQCVNSLNVLSVESCVHVYKPQHLWSASWLGQSKQPEEHDQVKNYKG